MTSKFSNWYYQKQLEIVICRPSIFTLTTSYLLINLFINKLLRQEKCEEYVDQYIIHKVIIGKIDSHYKIIERHDIT